jgi:hypothetical protein
MLYIRTLEIVDENDTVIHKIKQIPARIGLIYALNIIDKKEGGLKRYIKELDQDYRELFKYGI